MLRQRAFGVVQQAQHGRVIGAKWQDSLLNTMSVGMRRNRRELQAAGRSGPGGKGPVES